MLQSLHGNADLLKFKFDALHLTFHIRDGVFKGDLLAVANGKFAFKGVVSYTFDSKFATRLAPSKIPLPRSPAREVNQVPPNSPPR